VGDEIFYGIAVPCFVVLLLVSALFSGAETALTSMTKLRIKGLFSEGDPSYRKLETWLRDPNRYLVTILIGNNIVNIAASILATSVFTRLLEKAGWTHTEAFGGGLAFGTVAFLLLVFGEITPKTFAKQHAVRVSQLVIRPLDVLYRLFSPFILIFLGLSNWIVRLLGGQTVKEVPIVTAEDVRTLIEVSEKEGLFEREEREMIHSIIDFGDTVVREIMRPRVDIQALDSSAPFEEVCKAVVEGGHSRIPVYEGDIDSIVGVLHVKDLLACWRDAGRQWFLRDILRPTLFIPKNKKVNELLQTFRRERTHLAIVVDEYGCTAGLVTIEDVLEEIVGEIQDEYNQETAEYQLGENGEIIANAKVDLDLLREEFNIDLSLPDAEFQTLGGFITTYLGDLPAVGHVISYGSVEMTILEADDRRIKRVKIVRKPPTEAQEADVPKDAQ
jgi:CBS domain containing-hemolysin-like protein